MTRQLEGPLDWCALRSTLQNRLSHVRPRHRLTKRFLVLDNGLDLLQQLPLIFLLCDGLHGVPCLAYGRDERRELCIHNAFDHQPRRTISDGSSPFSRDLTETFMHSIVQASVCHVQMGATNAGEPEGVFHGWELPYRLQAQSFIEGPAIKMSRVLSATKCYKHIWRINSSKNTLVSLCLVASQSGDESSSRQTLAPMPCST